MGKKKANGEGSITKRKDGRYMGRYTVESKRKAVYGDSFEEVRQKLNEILNEIAKGAYVEPNKYSVEKWLREWLELYALYLHRGRQHFSVRECGVYPSGMQIIRI